MDEFWQRLRLYDSGKGVFVAVSEGIQDGTETYLEYASKSGKDAFGHVQLGSLSAIWLTRSRSTAEPKSGA